MTSRKTYRSESLTLEEQDQLCKAVSRVDDLALFRLALTTGIRREDIVGIEWSGVDFDQRRLTFWESKKSRHWTVPLTERTVQSLKMLQGVRRAERKVFGFCGRTAYNRLQAALERAGIKKSLRFHDLRRSFVKTAKRRGLRPKAVSQITGDTVAVIQEHYENMDQDELREELDRLED